MIPVAFDLRDPDRSGIARVARSLARTFVRQFASDFRVTLAGPVAQLESLGARRWGDSHIRLIPWDGARYSVAAELQWGRVKREAGDCIWYFPHWDVPWYSSPARYVVTIHDIGHLRLPGISWVRREVARRWMRRAARRARRVTVDTRFTADELVGVWPELAQKTQVVPNGVDELFFDEPQPLPDTIVSRLRGAPFALSVGIRKRHKNLAVGVDVLASIPDLRWVVIGEWFADWEDVAERAARMGVADRVIVLDRQEDGVLNSLYHQAACLLFPSRYEGFGLPILEALAAGTPVIASSAGGSVETLDGCGWVCDPDDAEQFARAVSQTLSLGGRRAEMAARARARARRFTWQNSASALAEALRQVV